MPTGLTDRAAQVALRKRIYTATVLKPARDKSFFLGDKGMLGKGMKDASKPVFYVNELTKTSKGDSCVMPFALELDYTRCMMAFLLFHPAPRRALMIGLGGGSLAAAIGAEEPQEAPFVGAEAGARSSVRLRFTLTTRAMCSARSR